MRLRWFLILLIVGVSAAQTTRKASSLSEATVRSEITACASGDTFLLPAGTATGWSSTKITIPSGCTVYGAGRNRTILDGGGNTGNNSPGFALTNGTSIDLGYMKLYNGTTLTWSGSGDLTHQHRLHNLSIVMPGTTRLTVSPVGSGSGSPPRQPYIIFSKTYFECIKIDPRGAAALLSVSNNNQNQLYAQVAPFGTEVGNIVFEANYATDDHTSGQCGGAWLDSNQASGWLVQRNTLKNTWLTTHTIQGPDHRGARFFEVLHNRGLAGHGTESWNAMGQFRSGYGYFLANKMDGAKPWAIDYRRYFDSAVYTQVPPGRCLDGLSGYDSNSNVDPAIPSYPCRDAPGQGPDVTLASQANWPTGPYTSNVWSWPSGAWSQMRWPLHYIGNTLGGSLSNPSVSFGSEIAIKPNIDAFYGVAEASFTCATGATTGAKNLAAIQAAWPGPCTTNVAYHSTSDKKVYIWSAGAWVTLYTEPPYPSTGNVGTWVDVLPVATTQYDGALMYYGDSLRFADQQTGTASATAFLTITNYDVESDDDPGTISITSITVPAHFQLVSGGDCPNSTPFTLQPNSDCTQGVQFAPTTAGLKTGTLTVNYTGSVGTSTTLDLSGTGIATPTAPTATMSASPSQLQVGQTFTLTWSSTNATSGSIIIPGVLSQTVCTDATTCNAGGTVPVVCPSVQYVTYYLVVQGAGGSVQSSAVPVLCSQRTFGGISVLW